MEHGLDSNDPMGSQGSQGDPDNDGLTNADEYARGTDPNGADSNNDDRTDGEEVGLGTDPINADSDGDDLPDGWELDHQLNPLDATGADGRAGDPDGDGRSNWDEMQQGTDPNEAFDFSTFVPMIVR